MISEGFRFSEGVRQLLRMCSDDPKIQQHVICKHHRSERISTFSCFNNSFLQFLEATHQHDASATVAFSLFLNVSFMFASNFPEYHLSWSFAVYMSTLQASSLLPHHHVFFFSFILFPLLCGVDVR